MPENATQLEQHRTALTGHCYRMLGSAGDADDAVQETMVRAWKALDGFDGRSSLRTWLYRIATHTCLDALSSRKRRERPMTDGPRGTVDDALEERPRTHWIEPVPDVKAIPADGDPAERAMLRQSIRLAFVAALQHLPPRQRAALILTEVLGWSAADVATTLETTTASVNSALQRARATLSERPLDPAAAALSDAQTVLVDRYFDAFIRYDIESLVSLLTEDAILSMPPYTLWLQGRSTIAAWLLGRGSGCRGSRLVPTTACGSPAFGQYRDDGKVPFALIVLELRGAQVGAMTSFLDTATLFPRFGLPLTLPD
jgi:RNA polymerase sigma-70 factor (ECF subfamily)